jgi:hypothetical protein
MAHLLVDPRIPTTPRGSVPRWPRPRILLTVGLLLTASWTWPLIIYHAARI